MESFRKTAITLRRAAGGSLRDVAKFARHRESTMTEDIYDLPSVTELRSVAELVGNLSESHLTNGGKVSDDLVADRMNIAPHTSQHSKPRRSPRVILSATVVSKNRRGFKGCDAKAKAVEKAMEPWGIEPRAGQPVLGEIRDALIAILDVLRGKDSTDGSVRRTS